MAIALGLMVVIALLHYITFLMITMIMTILMILVVLLTCLLSAAVIIIRGLGG